MLKKDNGREWGGRNAKDRAKALTRGKRAYTKMHTPAGTHACAHAHTRLLKAKCSLHREAE